MLLAATGSAGDGPEPANRETAVSGCGKTTLLNVIGGMLKPTDGYVELPPLGEIRWILQTSNILGRRTALDNAMLGLFSRGLTRRDARPIALDALTSVGLSQRAAGECPRLALRVRAVVSSRSG